MLRRLTLAGALYLGAAALPALEGYPWIWPPAAALAVLGSLALRRARQAAHRGSGLPRLPSTLHA